MLLCHDDEAAWQTAAPEALKDAMTEALAIAREFRDSRCYVNVSPLHSSRGSKKANEKSLTLSICERASRPDEERDGGFQK